MHTFLVAKNLQCHDVGPISFSVAVGQCIAITGPSGSGKSLLLRMVADLIPHTGECSLEDRPASSMPAPRWRQLVRYVSSEPGWWAPTVQEHFSDLTSFTTGAERLGLSPTLANATPERLSTGERQRTALLRALEHRPKVLLLDEPTSALDPESTLKVEAMVQGLMGEGMTVLLVSHDAAQVERLANTKLAIGAK